MDKDIRLKLKLDLKKYLNQKTKYSMNTLKNKIILFSDDDFLALICDLFEETIEKFNFETPVYYNKFLFKCIEYLDNEIHLEDKNLIVERLEKIKDLITNKINNNKSFTNVAISNKTFLLSLNSELSSIITKLKYDKDLPTDEINMNDIYNILNELIFKIKNPIYIEEIINNYPNLVIIKNNNRYLFEDVYDKYLNVLLNRNDDYELLYFNKLVLTFIKISKENNNEEIKNIALAKANKLLLSLDGRNLNIEKKERIIFFLKEILNIYKNEKIPNGKRIDNLKIKYNLKTISNLGDYKLMKPNWKEFKNNTNYILTFDDPNAKFFENALSLDCLKNGNYLLGIYISDISDYLNEDEFLKKYIYDNVMSVKGFPMLPKCVLDKLSLKERKKRKAIAYIFEIDSKLNIVKFKVERQNVSIKYNLKFSDVKKILNYPIDTKLKRKVSELYNFSKYLSLNKDEKKEYHEIKEISKKILYDNEYTEKNKGAKMVSDYQIFLNSFIPKYCYDRNLPYLYRNNEFNRSIELIDSIKDKYKENLNLQDLLSFIYAVYEPSYYSTENKGHAGLNLEAYGEVSRPLRSLASVINQSLINKYLIEGLILNDENKRVLINQLNKECSHLNKKRVLYDNYIYEVNKILKKKK